MSSLTGLPLAQNLTSSMPIMKCISRMILSTSDWQMGQMTRSELEELTEGGLQSYTGFARRRRREPVRTYSLMRGAGLARRCTSFDRTMCCCDVRAMLASFLRSVELVHMSASERLDDGDGGNLVGGAPGVSSGDAGVLWERSGEEGLEGGKDGE